jgi:hypothetical protein
MKVDRNQPDAAALPVPRNHGVRERVTHGQRHPRAAVCSNREIVDCDAKRPSIGSRLSNSLWIGSSASGSAWV